MRLPVTKIEDRGKDHNGQLFLTISRIEMPSRIRATDSQSIDDTDRFCYNSVLASIR